MSKRKRYAATVGQAVRKLGVSERTYYRWRREYGGMRVDHNPRRRHTSIGDLSPVEYERRPAAAAEAA